MTGKMVVDAQASPKKKRVVLRPDERLFRVKLVCQALVAEGRPFRYEDVAARAEMSTSTLSRYPDLHYIVEESRAVAAERAAASAVWSSSLPGRSPDATPEPVAVSGSIEEGERPGSGELSVAELAADYLAGRVERGEIGANTAEVMETRLAGLVKRCGHLSPRSLDRQMLLRWQASIGQFAPTSRRHYIGEVQRFTRWLVAEGFIASDPAVTLVRPREPRRAPRALPHKEVATLLTSLASAPESYRSSGWEPAAISLMLGCGLRCVEVSRLDLADYDEWEQTLTVRGKGGHQRVLPIPTAAAQALDRYIAERGMVAGPMFKAAGSKAPPDGRLSPAWISRRTARLMAQAGVHQSGDGRSAHALRHTAASDVLDRCHDVRTVQTMLGHQSLATTQIYLRSADLGTLRDAMAGRDYTSDGKRS